MADLTQLIAEVIVKDSASAAADRVAGAVQQMGDKVVASTRSLDAQAKSFERLKAAADPVYASQQRIANVQAQLAKATELGVASQQESALILNRVIAQTQAAEGGMGRFSHAIERSGIALGAMSIGLGSTERGLHSLFHTAGMVLFSFGNAWVIALGAALIGLTALAEQMGLFNEKANSAAARQKAFNDELDRASKLMDEINGKADRTRTSLFSERSNLIGVKENDITNIRTELALAQARQQAAQAAGPSGRAGAATSAVQIELLNKQLETAEKNLTILKATLGEFDEGTKRLGDTGGQPASIAAQKLKDEADWIKAHQASIDKADKFDKAYYADHLAAVDRGKQFELNAISEVLRKQKEAAAQAERDEKRRIELIAQRVTQEENALRAAQKAADTRAERLINAEAGVAPSMQSQIDDQKALNAALAEGAHAYAVEAQYLAIVNRYKAITGAADANERKVAHDLAEELVHQESVAQNLQAANQDLTTSINDLGQGFMDAARGSANWQNITLAAINAVSDAIIKMAKLDSGGQGGIGGLLGGLLKLVPSLFGGAAGGTAGLDFIAFPGHAVGGSMAAGEPGIVGERGPELFIPKTAGTVVPNGKWGGGSTYVINIAGDADESKIERVLSRHIPNITKAAENRAVRRASRSVNGANSWARSP